MTHCHLVLISSGRTASTPSVTNIRVQATLTFLRVGSVLSRRKFRHHRMQVDFYTELWLAALSRRVIVLACRRSGPSFLHLFLSTQHIPLATPPSRPVLTTTCSPSPVRPSSSRRDHTARRHRKLTCRVINTLIIMFETARKMFAAQPFRACAHMFAPPSWVLETSPSADPYYRPRDIVAPKTPVATQRPSEATHILHKTRKRKRNEIPKFSPWKKRKFAIVEEIIEEPTETALPSTDHAEQLPVAVAADNSGSNAEDNFGLPTPLSSPPEDENLVVTAHMPGDGEPPLSAPSQVWDKLSPSSTKVSSEDQKACLASSEYSSCSPGPCHHPIHPAYARLYKNEQCPSCRLELALVDLQESQINILDKGGMRNWHERTKEDGLSSESLMWWVVSHGYDFKHRPFGFDEYDRDVSHRHRKQRLYNLEPRLEQLAEIEAAWEKEHGQKGQWPIPDVPSLGQQMQSTSAAVLRFRDEVG
jgi:hypothetical protein